MNLDAGTRTPRYRWAVLLGLGLLVGIGGAYLAARKLSPQRAPPSEPAEAVDTDAYLAPIEFEPGTGEAVAPFSGFAVSIETEPADALVTVGGVERGEAPVLAGVECRPGAKVPIEVAKPGFRRARATTLCRSDALVKLTVRLRR
jgi:hypothetical protein